MHVQFPLKHVTKYPQNYKACNPFLTKNHMAIISLFSNIIYGWIDFFYLTEKKVTVVFVVSQQPCRQNTAKTPPSSCQELRASNDDRTDRDLQLDGGGISDQPVIIAVHPLAQVGGFGG